MSSCEILICKGLIFPERRVSNFVIAFAIWWGALLIPEIIGCTGGFWFVCLVDRVFANGPGDWSSIPGWVIPKTLKMVLDTSLLNTQYYKVRIKGKVEQSRGRSSTLSNTLV